MMDLFFSQPIALQVVEVYSVVLIFFIVTVRYLIKTFYA